MNARTTLLAGALAGLFTVLLGAFGAHALAGRLPAGLLSAWEKAVHYQGLHAVALLATGLLQRQVPAPALRRAAPAFTAGILLFSGSLYLLALSGERWLGAITPFGGTAFLAGWLLLALAVWREASP